MKLLFKKYCAVKSKAAFTLAEAVIILVLLGTVSAIVIPSTINNHNLAIKRTKVKQAYETYITAVRTMVRENNIRTVEQLNEFAQGPDNTCANARKYFKVVETAKPAPSDAAGNGCSFKTTNGMWYTVFSETQHANMNKTLLTFNNPSKTIKSLNGSSVLPFKIAEDTADNRAFFIASTFDKNGNIRIADLSYAYANVSDSYGGTMQFFTAIKLWAFLDNKDINDPLNGLWKLCKISNKDTDKIVFNTTKLSNGACLGFVGDQIKFYNSKGKQFFAYGCKNKNYYKSKQHDIKDLLKAVDGNETSSKDLKYVNIFNTCALAGSGNGWGGSQKFDFDEGEDSISYIDPVTGKLIKFEKDVFEGHNAFAYVCSPFGCDDYYVYQDGGFTITPDMRETNPGLYEYPEGMDASTDSGKDTISNALKAMFGETKLDLIGESLGFPKNEDGGYDIPDFNFKTLENGNISYNFYGCGYGTLSQASMKACLPDATRGKSQHYQWNTGNITHAYKIKDNNGNDYTIKFTLSPYTEKVKVDGKDTIVWKYDYRMSIERFVRGTSAGSTTYDTNSNFNTAISICYADPMNRSTRTPCANQ